MGKVKFNELDDKDKEYIRTIHAQTDMAWDERMSMLMNRFGVSERTVRKWISRLGYSQYKQIESQEVRQGKLRTYNPDKKVYILTWAQNATPVHTKLWENILLYADHINANVGVIQGRYQNPTSIFSNNMKADEWWDDAFTKYSEDSNGNPIWLDFDGNVIPDDEIASYISATLAGDYFDDRRHSKQVDFSYLDGGRHNIHPYVDILADVKIKPTAVNPLTGLEGVSGDRTSIIGHPKVHLKSLPVLKGHPSKMLVTTGACTLKNYTDTKSGKKAEFHHTYGFVVVELKDDLTFYVRQVTATPDGSFTDLNSRVSNGEITKIDKCSAFVFGDIHTANLEEKIMEKTMTLFEKITPRRVVVHDLFDGQSVNHHESKDPIKNYHRHINGDDILIDEINGVIEFFRKYDLIRFKPIVTRSNHDIWLDRWVVSKDWKQDIKNAREYMKYTLLLLEDKAPKGLIPYLLDEEFGDDILTLDLDDSFKINGWEVGQHGHLGTHGSKGNISQYRKLNTKVIVGDYHQPGRLDGAVGVGTYSKLRMGYNNGPSAWMHAGAMIHEDGKVQQIIFGEDGSFTTLL